MKPFLVGLLFLITMPVWLPLAFAWFCFALFYVLCETIGEEIIKEWGG